MSSFTNNGEGDNLPIDSVTELSVNLSRPAMSSFTYNGQGDNLPTDSLTVLSADVSRPAMRSFTYNGEGEVPPTLTPILSFAVCLLASFGVREQ